MPMPRPYRRKLLQGLVAGLASAVTVAALVATDVTGNGANAQPASALTGAAQVDAPTPDIDWQPCDDSLNCATVRVPLDYDDPDGPTTELALAQRPADDQDARIGTLFVNPGGPGESSVDYMPWFAENLPPAALERFDVVGIDPRGIGGSTPLRCSVDDTDPPEYAFPLTKGQGWEWIGYDKDVRRGCDSSAGAIIDHMTTADVARDMDLIRQAVGDEQLTYYGISYGSYLGATYAAMFPDRIRAMVVDGVIDPIGYATGHDNAGAQEPPTARWGSARGAWETLTRAFAECDRVGEARCPIAGEASATWMRIMDRLERGPVRIDGQRLTYQEVVAMADSSLRGVASYVAFMRFLDMTYDDMFGDPRERAEADSAAAYTRLRQLVNGDDGDDGGDASGAVAPTTQAVICADSVGPDDPRSWFDAVERAERRAPWFGSMWTWRSSMCAQWPGSSDDAFRGPFETETSAPVLLVATLHDPASPITGARMLNTLLEDSRMLTVDGWGHGALGESACLAAHIDDYLVSGALPPAGTVCDQDEEPYPS